MSEEKWVDVKGYEGLYLVSSLGRVKRSSGTKTSKKGKILKTLVDSRGYLVVGLTKDGKQKPNLVHRLVATAFLGDCPPGHECNHKNGVRTDARVDNLEWVTPSENLRHSFQVLKRKVTLRPRYGADHHNTKLTEPDIPRIRTLLAQGVSMRAIGREFQVHWTTIREIRDNKTWRQVR